jgi:hypothetical protein
VEVFDPASTRVLLSFSPSPSPSPNYIATDGQSVSKSWYRAPSWGPWPDIYCSSTVTSFLLSFSFYDWTTYIVSICEPHRKHPSLHCCVYNPVHSNGNYPTVCVFVAAGICLPSTCLEKGLQANVSLQQAVEAPTFSRQSAHRWRCGCQPYPPTALYPQEDSWYSFLLKAESSPGP